MELNLANHHPTGAEAGCRTCGRIFSSDRAFDAHRIGDPSEGRKCAENLSEAGLELDLKGRWRRPKYTQGKGLLYGERQAPDEGTDRAADGRVPRQGWADRASTQQAGGATQQEMDSPAWEGLHAVEQVVRSNT